MPLEELEDCGIEELYAEYAATKMLRPVHTELYKPGETGYILRQVPLRLIKIKPVWSPERYKDNLKLTRERATMPPIYISWNPETKLFDIGDGIHRANVAKDLGYQYIPAWLPEDEELYAETSRLKKIPMVKPPREPGVARCPNCKRVWDLDILRERPDYIPGLCPRCQVGLKSITERK